MIKEKAYSINLVRIYKFVVGKLNFPSVLLMLAYGLILMISEIIVRYAYSIPPLEKFYLPFFNGIIIATVILYSRPVLASIILSVFVCLSYLFQYSNISYFGYWIAPMDIWLAFEKMHEVTEAGLSTLAYQVVAFAGIFFIFLSTLALLFFRKLISAKKSWLGYLGVAMVFFYPVQTLLNQENTIGRIPKMKHDAMESSLYTFGYFVGHIIPEEVFGQMKVPYHITKKPLRVNEGLSENIIVVMGESLASEYMSVYGYEKPTTPWLEQEHSGHSSFIGQGFAGGLFTDVSVPFFFNLVEKPNALKQISLGNSNLFRMAKSQGYNTAYYSAQANSSMQFMSFIDSGWIDDYRDSSLITKDRNKNVDDAQLVKWLKQSDLSGKNFIVLQQNGSHEPYREKSPKEQKVFGEDSLYSEYLNSVLYTDKILETLTSYLSASEQSWTLIFTSDHGQHVTMTSAGKGSFKHESNYIVPIFIKSDNQEIVDNARMKLGQCDIVFQLQLGSFVADVLGYKAPDMGCSNGYVSGKRLTGNSGYMKITKDSGNNYKKEILYQ